MWKKRVVDAEANGPREEQQKACAEYCRLLQLEEPLLARGLALFQVLRLRLTLGEACCLPNATLVSSQSFLIAMCGRRPGSSRRNESIIIVFFWSEREKALFWQTTGSCLGLPRCCCCDDRFEFVVVGELESEVRRSCLEAFCPNRRDSAPHDGN